ncbi:MAG: hypothetical protein GY820_33155, partial [Gammaproteobacteria bacterium]|nr:hypothetical protein [Gammaproteobacteria bacterium]
SEIDDKYILSDKLHSSFLNKKGDFGQRFKPQIEKINPKAACLLASGDAWKVTGDYIKLDRKGNKKGSQNKASCLTGGGNSGGNHSDMDILCVAMRGRNPDNSSDRTPGAPTEQRLEAKTDGKTNCLTTVQKDNLVIIQKARGYNKGGKFTDKSPTLTSNSFEHNNHVQDNYKLRRLTPIECGRLQTIPDWYEWIVSNTQQYKMLGNGWTIEVIKHLFKDLQQFEHLT